MKNQVELQTVHSKQVYDLERPCTNSIIATSFRMIGDQMKNQTSVDQSRRQSRKMKGLNPDAPRAPQMKKGIQWLKEERLAQKQVNKQKARQKSVEIQEMDEHKIPLEQLCQRLRTSLQQGLSTEQAIKRNLEEGDNKLPYKKKTPMWIKFLKEITNWFAIMLWIAAILCIISYVIQPEGNLSNFYLAFVLIFVVILTGVITFAQGAKSEALMQGFKNMLPSVTKVIRDGKLTQIPAQKLVRGDVVQIISGQKIPADLRIIASTQMKVDNSNITGEVEPLLRSTECSHPEQPFETKNLAFFGTLCKEGRGRGIVIGIAEKTVMGQIGDLTFSCSIPKSFLRSQLDRLVLIITAIGIFFGVVFFLLAIFVLHFSALECVTFGIGILVANVPEGLLGCITISLAITAKKLAHKQVLIKNLQDVEKLGCISCICCDKTGTLTQNRMKVENLWYDEQIRRGDNKQVKGAYFEYEYNVDDPSFKVLHHTAMICSEAKFDVSEQTVRSPGFKYTEAPVMGDASETALVKFYQPIEDISRTRALYEIGKCQDGWDSKMPFNSTNKYALSIVHQEGPDHHWVAYIKGAPEKVWKYCGRIIYEGKHRQIGTKQKKMFNDVNLRFEKNGETVLGFAMLPLDKEKFGPNFKFITSKPDNFNFPMENFIFVGLISLMDPPKKSVPSAIKKCQAAGIKVIMITGDRLPTAAAIAKQIGIITLKTNLDMEQEGYSTHEALAKANAIIIHGDMITKAFQEGEQTGIQILNNWCSKPQVVFARTSPSQKLQIVTACQNIGHFCSVTSDGVGDSPSLKQADIGISMGISGSDVSNDAADIILLNDDFGSLVDGIEEGRKIFDNLKKIIVYLLTSNVTKIWPFFGLVILQVPLPLSNIFMLCISMGTDIYPAISLAYEQAEIHIMTRKPRMSTDHLVSAKLLAHAYGQMGLIATAGGFFTYFVIMNLYGFDYNVIFGLVSQKALVPNNDTLYNIPYNFDINNVTYGGPLPSNCNNAVFQQGFPSWISDVNSAYDLRASYVTCDAATGAYNLLFPKQFYTREVLQTTSPITKQPVAWTTESIFYAQSGYFVTIVMVQWSNLFACKSRKTSIIYSNFNIHMLGGILVETFLFIFLLYVPEVNRAFGGRPLDFFLLGVPGLGFSMILLLWEQSRKFLMNMDTNNGKPNWWQRNLLW